MIRGSGLKRQQTSMLLSAISNSFLAAVFTTLLLTSIFFYIQSNSQNRAVLWANLVSHFNLVFSQDEALVSIHLSKGNTVKTYSLPPTEMEAVTEQKSRQIGRVLKWSAGWSSLLGMMVFFSLLSYWSRAGKRAGEDTYLRGAQLVEAEVLGGLIKTASEVSAMTLGGVTLRQGSELLHCLISGATGTGKSIAMMEVLDSVRQQKKREVVYDPSGEYIERYYRPGRDIILNPLDARSPSWNIWQEVRSTHDYATMASVLVPDDKSGHDLFWTQAARVLFEDLAAMLARTGEATNRALYEAISKMSLKELSQRLAGTAGAALVDPIGQETAQSVKMSAMAALKAFRYLHDEGELFSIRRWVENTQDDSWLFVGCPEDQLAALKPIITLMLDVVIRAVMTLPIVREPQLYLVIDELPDLNRFSLPMALTKCRKYGLACVLGVQDYPQLVQA